MNVDSVNLIVILAMAVITYLTRLGGVFISRRLAGMDARMRAAFEAIPPVVLIAVVAPSGSPNQVAAALVAVQVEDALRGAGVPGRSIEYRVYRAGPEERNAPVRIAFNRITAHTEPCGPWQDQTSKVGENRHHSSFGCATQQNLAAMVASPLDLLYPRGMTPADATRRADVLEKYRTGAAFSSDTSREPGSTIAQGVGN